MEDEAEPELVVGFGVQAVRLTGPPGAAGQDSKLAVFIVHEAVGYTAVIAFNAFFWGPEPELLAV